MALIDEAKAKVLLGTRIHDLWEIINGGCQDYISYYSERIRLLHCKGTRAGIIHDHQVARASSYAIENAALGIRLVDLSKLKVLLIDERFAIRFKKLDAFKRPSNQVTQQVRAFRNQRDLEGLPTTFNLEAGYVLTTNNEISDISLVCPNGINSTPYWDMELTQDTSRTVVKDLFDNSADRNGVEEDAVEDGAIVVPRNTNNVIKLEKESG